MVETALFSLALPYLSEQRLRKNFILLPISQKLEKRIQAKKAVVALTPHFALMEACTLAPWLYGDKAPETGVIYRPLKNRGMEDHIKRSRQRFKANLLSRKEGFNEAQRILRDGGWVDVLFDQNAGKTGTLTTFFDRLCSVSELAGLLCQKHNAQPVIMWTERTGFWNANIRIQELNTDGNSTDTTKASNQWLEDALKQNETLCASWLWIHNRWKTQDNPRQRFRINQKRTALPEKLKRTERLWVRMPNWLGDVVMALPLLKAIRQTRPDMELTLLARPHLLPLLEHIGIAEQCLALPQKGFGYYRDIAAWRKQYPDTHLLFTNSTRGDIEARIIGTPQRFSMIRPDKNRGLLTHAWNIPSELDETQIHQTHVWLKMLEHFGLQAEPDYTPFKIEPAILNGTPNIGLICGTENAPEKRWPIQHWKELCTHILDTYPKADIVLFGTAKDRTITNEVAEGFDQRILNRAGKTNLVQFMRELSACDVLVANDTGGMHLANALGVSVIGIFGPTNPIRTGPVFDAQKVILQPKGCPPTGGKDISLVSAKMTMDALKQTLKQG